MTDAAPLVVRADLPTLALVLVRDGDGGLVLFADARVPQAVVDDALADVDGMLSGPAHALG